MMTAKCAGAFDLEDDLDVSGFTPKPADCPAAKPEQARSVSEAAQFQSREPGRDVVPLVSAKREPWRYRTGRNSHLNIKARGEAIETFYAIAEGQRLALDSSARPRP